MKFQVNRYLKQIATETGESDVNRAVQIFVKRKLGSSESLEVSARKLGVTEIAEDRLSFEGGVFNVPEKGLVIKLNAESSPTRKRFTLAHELSHLLLGTVPGRRSMCREDPALESACDSIAAELLMPSEQAIGFVRDLGQPSPEKLRAIASRYDVSLRVAAIRVHSTFRLWKCCIGFWERNPTIKTVWFVGRRRWDRTEPDSYSLDLALSSNAAVQSKELWQRGPITDPVWLSLLRIGNSDRVLGLVGFVN